MGAVGKGGNKGSGEQVSINITSSMTVRVTSAAQVSTVPSPLGS